MHPPLRRQLISELKLSGLILGRRSPDHLTGQWHIQLERYRASG